MTAHPTMKRSPLKPGKPLQRKTALRSGAPMKSSRTKTLKPKKIAPTSAEREWMAAVAHLGCIICRMQGRGYVPTAVHHIVEGGRRLGHLFTIGLCDPGHHQGSPDPAQISRHPDKARFIAAYGSEYDLLKATQDILAGKAPSYK